MPATSKQKGDLIRQHLQIEKHLDEIAKILEITVSKLENKLKAGSWWDLSQKDAKKVLDFLRTVWLLDRGQPKFVLFLCY